MVGECRREGVTEMTIEFGSKKEILRRKNILNILTRNCVRRKRTACRSGCPHSDHRLH